MMTLEQANEIKKELNTKVDELSKQINSFEKGIMGLAPDHVRESTEYQEVDKAYRIAFKQLQEFNKYYVKNFRKKGKRKAG